MIIMASGIARGRVRTTHDGGGNNDDDDDDGGVAQDRCHTPNNRLTERHAALVYCVLLWYWTSML